MTSQEKQLLNQGFHSGYTLAKNGASWTPEKFQEQATKDHATLQAALEQLTKTQLTEYVKSHGGIPHGGKALKSDLVTQAWCLQWSVLYPALEAANYKDQVPL